MSDGCCLVPLFLTAFNFWFIYVLLVVSFFYYGIGICFLLCVAILRHFLARLFFISWFFASNRDRFYLYTVHDLSWLKGNWWKRRYFKTHACVWVTVRHNIWRLDMTLSDNHCSVLHCLCCKIQYLFSRLFCLLGVLRHHLIRYLNTIFQNFMIV